MPRFSRCDGSTTLRIIFVSLLYRCIEFRDRCRRYYVEAHAGLTNARQHCHAMTTERTTQTANCWLYICQKRKEKEKRRERETKRKERKKRKKNTQKRRLIAQRARLTISIQTFMQSGNHVHICRITLTVRVRLRGGDEQSLNFPCNISTQAERR